mgnify:FL=1
MNEEIRSTIALIAGAIVFVVCYIKLFLKGKSSRQRFIERAKEQGSFVTATLIDHKRRLGNDESGNSYFQNDRMKCTYEYKVNGITYKKKLTCQSPGLVSIKLPYEITVYYDPRNPAKSVCKEEASQGAQRSAGCLGTIIFAIVAFELAYNLLKLI